MVGLEVLQSSKGKPLQRTRTGVSLTLPPDHDAKTYLKDGHDLRDARKPKRRGTMRVQRVRSYESGNGKKARKTHKASRWKIFLFPAFILSSCSSPKRAF